MTSFAQTTLRTTSAVMTPVPGRNFLQPTNSQAWRKSRVQGMSRMNQSAWASPLLSTKKTWECDPDIFCKRRLPANVDLLLFSFSLSESFFSFSDAAVVSTSVLGPLGRGRLYLRGGTWFAQSLFAWMPEGGPIASSDRRTSSTEKCSAKASLDRRSRYRSYFSLSSLILTFSKNS